MLRQPSATLIASRVHGASTRKKRRNPTRIDQTDHVAWPLLISAT